MSEVFMVWVEGRRQPRKRHATLKEALSEAKRLSHVPEIQHKRIFVLSDIDVVGPTGNRIESPKEQSNVPVVIVKKKRLIISPE